MGDFSGRLESGPDSRRTGASLSHLPRPARSLHHTVTSLDRKPRQLVVHSLEEDLYADAQTLSPLSVSAAPAGFSLSPFRIVRIVDREGRIASVRENAETVLECSRQGYYRHPHDCTR